MGKVGKVEEMADFELFENETRSKPEAGTDQHRRTKLVKFTVIAAIVIIALLIVIIVPTLWVNGGGKEQKSIDTSANTDTNYSKINTEAGFDRFVTTIPTHDVPKGTSTYFDQFVTLDPTHGVPKANSTDFDLFVTVVPTNVVQKHPGPNKDIRFGPSYIIMSNLDGTVLQGEEPLFGKSVIKLGPYTHENRQHFKPVNVLSSFNFTRVKFLSAFGSFIVDQKGNSPIVIFKRVSVIDHVNNENWIISKITAERGIVNIESESLKLCLANGGNNSISTEGNLVFKNCSMVLEMQWRFIPVC